MSAPLVRRERRGGVLLVTIDRDASRNAIDDATAAALAAAWEELEGDEELAIGVLAGAGAGFCAGMDLKAFLRGESGIVPGRGFGAIVERPPGKPICAAVEGFALAGGFEIVLACDLVVAARDARFGLPEVTRGLIAGAGGIVRLAERLGPARAMEAVLTGAEIDAPQAYEWGLVGTLCEPGESVATALELATRIAANAPLAVQLSTGVGRCVTAPGPAAWEAQSAALAIAKGSADAAEGASAFAERRAPAWSGR